MLIYIYCEYIFIVAQECIFSRDMIFRYSDAPLFNTRILTYTSLYIIYYCICMHWKIIFQIQIRIVPDDEEKLNIKNFLAFNTWSYHSSFQTLMLMLFFLEPFVPLKCISSSDQSDKPCSWDHQYTSVHMLFLCLEHQG